MSHMPPAADDFLINVKNYGAKGDGATNDTVAIQAAITAAGTDGLVFFPSGTYRLANVTIDSKTRLTMLGDSGVTLKLLDTITNPMFRIGDAGASTDVTFSGFTFDGNSYVGTTNGTALRVRNQTRFRVLDCRFQNFWNHAISFPSTTLITATSFISISRCSFQNLGRGYTADNTFSANSPSGCGIVSTSTTPLENVRVDGCVFDTIKGAGAIYFTAVTGCRIADCYISNTGYRGIKIGAGSVRCQRVMIRDCTILDCGSVYESSLTPGAALYGQGSNGIYISKGGVQVASDVDVQGCYIANCGETGIEGLCYASGNTIVNPGYAYADFGSGIAMSGIYVDSGCVARGNIVINPRSHGITLFVSGTTMTDIVIADNYIESPGLRGLFMQIDGAAGQMRRCDVRNNKVYAGSASPTYGVRLQASNGASIDSSNVVLGNIVEGTFSSGAQSVDGTAIQGSEFDSTGARVTVRAKAGVPSDADFSISPADGTMVIDTTNSDFYVRCAGSWKKVAVA